MIINHKDDGTGNGRNFLAYPPSSDQPPRMKEGAETVFSHDRPAVSVRCNNPSVNPELFYTSDGRLYLRRTWEEWFRVRITDMKHLIQLLKKPNTQLIEINERGEVTERSMGIARIQELPRFLFPEKRTQPVGTLQQILEETAEKYELKLNSDDPLWRTLSGKDRTIDIGSIFSGENPWTAPLNMLSQLYGKKLEERLSELSGHDGKTIIPALEKSYIPANAGFLACCVMELEDELKKYFK